jgi:hypothetical protein
MFLFVPVLLISGIAGLDTQIYREAIMEFDSRMSYKIAYDALAAN